MDSSRQIEDTAAAWLVRRDGEDFTRAEEVEFAEWLNASFAHRVAYLRLESAWEHTHRLQALGAGVPQGHVPAVGQWHVSPFFASSEAGGATNVSEHTAAKRVLPMRFALAASLAALFVTGVYLFLTLGVDRYTTPVGAVVSVLLEDGSNVTLNTASKIQVRLNEHERRIRLDDGEAFFDVARDPNRPFIVDAGKRRIVAVGTRFSVRRRDDEVSVLVTEGQVRLEGADSALLGAGASASATDAKVQIVKRKPDELEQSLTWRTGYLTFDSVPLSQAVAEFNRYTRREITIQDPALAAVVISGKFRASNVDAFIRVLHEGFGIDAQPLGGGIMLTR